MIVSWIVVEFVYGVKCETGNFDTHFMSIFGQDKKII
jgi:hypothetical protein